MCILLVITVRQPSKQLGLGEHTRLYSNKVTYIPVDLYSSISVNAPLYTVYTHARHATQIRLYSDSRLLFWCKRKQEPVVKQHGSRIE